MLKFNDFIKDARKSLGFKTAKEFYRAKSAELSMSYESYANLEAGKYLPPAESLERIIKSLEISNIRDALMSFAHSLMPNDYFRSFFNNNNQNDSVLLKNDSYLDYKEKFQALLEFNRLQTKYELTEEQIRYLENDLIGWDIVNLFVTSGDDGLAVSEIAEKTNASIAETQQRIENLIAVGILKKLANEKYLVTQDSFNIPRKPIAEKLAQNLVKRELDLCFSDKRNKPYMRFRFMAIDPEQKENMESFIDNFILDSRKFKKNEGGKTHYLQVLFSDRNDLH